MIEMNHDLIEKLIEKSDAESPTAYSAFLFWAMIPPNQRSNDISAPIIAKHFGISELTVRQYRSQNKWEERANQLDAYLFKLSIMQRAEMFEENNKNLASEMREIQKTGIECSKLGLDAVKFLLQSIPIANKVLETDWVYAIQSDGTKKKVACTTELKMELNLRDASNLLRESLNAPIKAMGLPTEVVRYSVIHADKPLETKSDDELEREYEELQKELKGTIKEISNVQ